MNGGPSIGQVRLGRRFAYASGIVAAIGGLGLMLTACGSSAGGAAGKVTRLSSSCIPPAFRLSGSRPAPANRALDSA